MQDNQSAIRMKKNGEKSCTGDSRNVAIRYFFVKDRVDKKEIKLQYCPTEKMIADYYTKDLQVNVFRRYWKVIMGHKFIEWLDNIVTTSKERVGDKNPGADFLLVVPSIEINNG